MRKKTIVLLLMMFIALLSLGAFGNQETAADYADHEELYRLIQNPHHDYLLIDVRTPEEFRAGHIPTAVNIPVTEIGVKIPKVSKDSIVIVYCRSGNRSATAAQILERAGFSNIFDAGGIKDWPYEVVR